MGEHLQHVEGERSDQRIPTFFTVQTKKERLHTDTGEAVFWKNSGINLAVAISKLRAIATNNRRLIMINYASSEDVTWRLRIADKPMANKPGSIAAGVGTAVSSPVLLSPVTLSF